MTQLWDSPGSAQAYGACMEDAPSVKLLLVNVLVWTGFLYEANKIWRYLRGIG